MIFDHEILAYFPECEWLLE